MGTRWPATFRENPSECSEVLDVGNSFMNTEIGLTIYEQDLSLPT